MPWWSTQWLTILLDTMKAFSLLLQICISSTIEIDARVQKLVQKGNYFYDIRIFHKNNNKNHHKHWAQIECRGKNN